MNEYKTMAGGPVLENLLDSLKEFIEISLRDYQLPMKKDGWQEQPDFRALQVHEMVMPEPDESNERIPYVLLQLINGRDERDEKTGEMVSIVEIRIIITIHNLDKQEARMQLLSIVQSLRRDFIQAGVIGGCFELVLPLEYLIYPDEIEWYHLAEMATQWTLPTVERNIPELDGYDLFA